MVGLITKIRDGKEEVTKKLILQIHLDGRQQILVIRPGTGNKLKLIKKMEKFHLLKNKYNLQGKGIIVILSTTQIIIKKRQFLCHLKSQRKMIVRLPHLH